LLWQRLERYNWVSMISKIWSEGVRDTSHTSSEVVVVKLAASVLGASRL